MWVIQHVFLLLSLQVKYSQYDELVLLFDVIKVVNKKECKKEKCT